MRWLRKFLSLPSPERWLLLEAVLWLTCTWLALHVVPFRWLAPALGQYRAESPYALPPEDIQRAQRIARIVGMASRHLPWTCTCLVQAIAGMQLLRGRGQSCTLYLGVAKDQAQQLCAHAWLRSGEVFVTGGHERHGFVVVGSFRQAARRKG